MLFGRILFVFGCCDASGGGSSGGFLAERLAERLAEGWLAGAWLAEGWLADSWLAEGWLVEGWLAEGWRKMGWRVARGLPPPPLHHLHLGATYHTCNVYFRFLLVPCCELLKRSSTL